MINSYVGIASQEGLEVFVPEHEHVVRFLARRAGRRHAACYWAVMPEEAAAEVRRLLDLGEPYEALLALNLVATQIGPLLPHPPDPASPPTL
jgi:hypothetical protein